MFSVDSQIPATARPTTGALPCLPPLTPAASPPSCEVSPPRSAPLRVRRVEPVLVGNGTGAAEPFAPTGELAALAGVWNLLADTVPFRSFEWMESWWRHYQLPGWQTYLLTVEDAAGAIVGIAPWYVASSPIAGRVVQFMGSGEACSEYLTVLARPGSECEIATALWQWLSTDGARDWDLLQLAAVLESDPAASAFVQEFARQGHLIHQQPGMPCWQCELPATWDEFVRQLSKSRRERVRQLTRKYFDTGRVETRWVATEAELDSAFAMFVDMHRAAAAKAWANRGAMRRSDSPSFTAKSVAAYVPRASYVCCGRNWMAGPSAPNTTSLTVEPFITIRRALNPMRPRTTRAGWR